MTLVKLFKICFLVLLTLTIAGCSQQRYAYRQKVKMNPVEVNEQERRVAQNLPTQIEPLESEIHQISVPESVLIPTDKSLTESKTNREKAKAVKGSAEPVQGSVVKEQPSNHIDPLKSQKSLMGDNGVGLLLLSLALLVLAFIIFIYGFFIALSGAILGGITSTVTLLILLASVLVIVSFVLFYYGLARWVAYNHQGSKRSPGSYRSRGWIGFAIIGVIGFFLGLVPIIHGLIWLIVHLKFANYLERRGVGEEL